MSTIYVNRREDSKTVETVDQFDYNTKEERQYAQDMVAEYQMADPSAEHYLSRRACNDWKKTA